MYLVISFEYFQFPIHFIYEGIPLVGGMHQNFYLIMPLINSPCELCFLVWPEAMFPLKCGHFSGVVVGDFIRACWWYGCVVNGRELAKRYGRRRWSPT